MSLLTDYRNQSAKWGRVLTQIHDEILVATTGQTVRESRERDQVLAKLFEARAWIMADLQALKREASALVAEPDDDDGEE